MDCAEVREKLVAAIDGELMPAESTAVQAHIDGCDACRAERESIVRLYVKLSAWSPVAQASPAFVGAGADRGVDGSIELTTPLEIDLKELNDMSTSPMNPPQPGKKPVDQIHLDELLSEMIDNNVGSDMYLAAGVPPILRSDGQLVSTAYESCNPADVQRIVYAVLQDEQVREFERQRQFSFVYALRNKARFLVELLWENGHVGACFRLVPTKIPTPHDLGLPAIVEKLTHTKRGLILIAGGLGHGKTTTAYAMLNHINLNRSSRIHTIERLVSYRMGSKMSLVTQQSVGIDTPSYGGALESARRMGADVVMVDELLTAASVLQALETAEYGALVLAQVPGDSVPNCLDGLLDRTELPEDIARRRIARVLQGIVAQRLLTRATGRGRVAVHEIAIATNALRDSILAGGADLTSIVDAGDSYGMVTMSQSIATLYRQGIVTYETAMREGVDPATLRG